MTESTPNIAKKPGILGTGGVLTSVPQVVLIGGSQDGSSPGESSQVAENNPEALSRVSSGPAYSAFSRSSKRWVIAMVTISSFVSPMTALIYFPALNPISKDLGVSIGLINLTVTSYMIFQGLSPTIFGDFGDVAGRRPAFIVAFSIYICANIGLALQNNYAALLVLRCLQSTGSSGTLALGFAVVADIATSAERGKYMGIVGAGINIGPTLGPVIGGVLSQYLGWRAIFWFCAILVGTWLIPFILTVPETCRNVVGNGSTPARGWNLTLIDYIQGRRDRGLSDDVVVRQKIKIPNPLHTLTIIFEKDMALILFYNSLLYVCFMDVNATLSTQFAELYHYSDLQIGLCYLPFGAGCCIAAIAQGYILDWNYRRVARAIGFRIDKKRGDDLSGFPIELARIQPTVPTLILGLAVYASYGWVLDVRPPVAAPLILQFFIGVCITGSFSVLNTLIVDLHPTAPATATAANNLVRCSMGAVGTAVIESMITGMGRGWCFTFLAGLSAILSPALWIIVKRGPRWRRERAEKTAKAAEKKQETARVHTAQAEEKDQVQTG